MITRQLLAAVGLTTILTVPVSLAFAVIWPSVIKAHDIYTVLKDGSGRSCCSDHDCRPARYRSTPVGVQMLIGGEWILFPNGAIQYRVLDGDSGETAGGHWCGLRGSVVVTFCAILPPSQASATQPESNQTQESLVSR